ncbi:MAG: helix-turn-helix domain-containing protein, partial [Desulfotomaculales bacterium]
MQANNFGKFLRKLRKERGLTIRQLETYSGVSNAYLSQVETGKRGVPSPEILEKLAPVLKVSYELLMEKAGYLKSNDNGYSAPTPEQRIAEALANDPELLDFFQALINRDDL